MVRMSFLSPNQLYQSTEECCKDSCSSKTTSS